MGNSILSARYGKAVCDLAVEEGDMGVFVRELETLKLVFDEFPDFRKILSNEAIDKKRRFELIDSVFSKLSIGSILANAMKLLVERGRANIARDVVGDAVIRIKNRMNVEVVGAMVADESIFDECRRIIELMMGEALNKKVECEASVDRSLLGGFTVKYGGKTYDASLKGRLARMMETIA